jgi:hypothetical protein
MAMAGGRCAGKTARNVDDGDVLGLDANEKASSFAELHGMMVKLADETAQVDGARRVDLLTSTSLDADKGRSLAANP